MLEAFVIDHAPYAQDDSRSIALPNSGHLLLIVLVEMVHRNPERYYAALGSILRKDVGAFNIVRTGDNDRRRLLQCVAQDGREGTAQNSFSQDVLMLLE